MWGSAGFVRIYGHMIHTDGQPTPLWQSGASTGIVERVIDTVVDKQFAEAPFLRHRNAHHQRRRRRARAAQRERRRLAFPHPLRVRRDRDRRRTRRRRAGDGDRVGLGRHRVPGRDLHLDRVRAHIEIHLLAGGRPVGVGDRRVARVEILDRGVRVALRRRHRDLRDGVADRRRVARRPGGEGRRQRAVAQAQIAQRRVGGDHRHADLAGGLTGTRRFLRTHLEGVGEAWPVQHGVAVGVRPTRRAVRDVEPVRPIDRGLVYAEAQLVPDDRGAAVARRGPGETHLTVAGLHHEVRRRRRHAPGIPPR